VIDIAGTDARDPWDDYEILKREIEEYSAEMAERPSVVVANKMDAEGAADALAKFREKTGTDPIPVSCATREGLDAFREALRKAVDPAVTFHHSHDARPANLEDMPDTTGEEIPAEALKYATFLKLEKPRKKSHPSRGNIHA